MTEEYLSPRETGKFVTKNAVLVSIDDGAVASLSQLVADAAQEGKLSSETTKYEFIMPPDTDMTFSCHMNWVFVVDAINFNFWTKDGEPKYVVQHGKEVRAGYLGMVTAVNRAIAEGKPMYDPKYYGKLSMEELKHIFRSSTASTLPLFEERMKILKDVSETLITKYKGCFSNVVLESKGDALALVDIIVRDFESFRDRGTYCDTGVSLLKRAQIVAADLDVLCYIKGKPGLKNIDRLTMFADYRVPQVLHYYGALKYTKDLLLRLEAEELFENGSKEEVEIRACSIEAVERVVAETQKALQSRGLSEEEAKKMVTSVKVDYFLWGYRVKNAKKLQHVPYHRTRCIYY